MTASLPDRLRKAADELDSMRCAEDAALMREAAEALELSAQLRAEALAAADALCGPDPQGRAMTEWEASDAYYLHGREATAMRLYLHHRPDTGATDVRVEANYSGPGRMFMVRPEQVFPYEEEREYVHVAPGAEPPLYCPPIPDAEMARLLGIRP